MTRSTGRVAAWAVLACLSSGCSGPGDGAGASLAGDFCTSAASAVDAYLARMSQERPAPSDDRFGGTAVVGSIGELVGGMNALTSPDYAATQHQQHVLLTTLVTYDDTLGLRPYLARSWDISPDGTEVTFHLRGDVFWHDGERTGAADVAFTYLRATDPETAYPNPAAWDGYVRGPEGVRVVDDTTVVVRLEPHAEFMDVWTNLAIMPEHLLGDVPAADLAQHPFGTVCPVGNGPFVFREHLPGDRWTFTANPGFPEELGGRPRLDRYVYRVVADENTLLAELLTGGIDLYVAPPADQAERIAADAALELRHYPFRNVVFVAWNSRRPALADPAVRRAITMATPRQEMVDGLAHGYGAVANGRIPPFHWAYRAEPEGSIAFDPDGARALLDHAGWVDADGDGVREGPDGTPLSLVIEYNTGSQQRAEIATLMQARLSDVGIGVRVRSLDFATLITQITDAETRDFDGVVMAFVTDFRIDDRDLFHSGRIDEPYAWSGTHDPTLDRILEELPGTVDRTRAKALWADYERELIREQPFTFLYFPERLAGVRRSLRDVRMDARGEWINVGEWWIDPEARR